MKRPGVTVGAAAAIAAVVAVPSVLAGCGQGSTPGRGTSALGAARATVSSASTPSAASSTAASTVAPTVDPTPTPSPTPKPKPNHCAANTAAQLVLVSVTSQRVWLCEHSRQVYEAPVTTGAVDLPYDATPTGTFAVQSKQTDRTLTLLSGAQYQVKYWIPFDAPLFGFHDASWQDIPFGSQRYRTQGSHGCVHLPLAAMAFLYKWVDLGTTVTVRA